MVGKAKQKPIQHSNSIKLSQPQNKIKKFIAPKITFEPDDKYMRIRHDLGEQRQLARKELASKSLLSSSPSGL